MAIYTFRPEKPDDSALTMRFVNLPTDQSAKAHARTVLMAYPMFDAVEVWEGERLVECVARLRTVAA